MTMNAPSANLSVCLTDDQACLRIAGRATFHCSADFKKVIIDLAQTGRRAFSLDLEQCLSMDSTFLGVLLGLRNGKLIADTPVSFGLIKPSPRILGVLDSLGVAALFQICDGNRLAEANFVPVVPGSGQTDKLEISRLCLNAHQTLMDANPSNVGKFKDVTALMKEELSKLEGGEGKAKS